MVEVPAFAALGRAQFLGPLGARGAHVREGVPARHKHLLGAAGVEVGAAELHRPDAAAVLDGELAYDVAGQRLRRAVRRVYRLRVIPGSPCRRGRVAHQVMRIGALGAFEGQTRRAVAGQAAVGPPQTGQVLSPASRPLVMRASPAV